MHAMHVVIREVPVDCLAVASAAYRQEQERRTPPKATYTKALAAAQRLSQAAGHPDVVAAIKSIIPSDVIDPSYINWLQYEKRGFSKPLKIALAFRETFRPATRDYGAQLVGVIMFGRYNSAIEPRDSRTQDPDRPVVFLEGLAATETQPAVTASGLHKAITDKSAGIIEVLARVDGEAGVGVGSLLVEHAVLKMTYAHKRGVIFSNLTRSSTLSGQNPVESHYQAAPLLRAHGFRRIPRIRYGSDSSMRTTGMWLALTCKTGWERSFGAEMTRELAEIYGLCPVTPNERAPLARCILSR